MINLLKEMIFRLCHSDCKILPYFFSFSKPWLVVLRSRPRYFCSIQEKILGCSSSRWSIVVSGSMKIEVLVFLNAVLWFGQTRPHRFEDAACSLQGPLVITSWVWLSALLNSLIEEWDCPCGFQGTLSLSLYLTLMTNHHPFLIWHLSH